MLTIVQSPATVLSQTAKPIARIDKAIRRLIKEMEETLVSAHDPEGVGLAAPQIGKSLQLFVTKQSPRSPLLTFINPHIESFFDESESIRENSQKIKENQEKEKGVQLEGCLSVKDIWGVVKRQYGIVLSYMDEYGIIHKRKFDGFIATILQHECDHLQGVLFTKRVLQQHGKLYRSVKNTEGETEFEEIEV